jgi:hypothetical protein
MKLVDYSSESESDTEDSPPKHPSPPPAPRPHHAILPKPAKKQILVDLPKPAKEPEEEVKKRPRPEAGGGGLFSMLPPPKRAKTGVSGGTSGTSGGNGVAKPAVGEPERTVLEGEKETPPVPVEIVKTTAFVPRSTKQKKGTTASTTVSSAKAEPLSLFPLGPELTAKVAPVKSSNTSTYEPLISQPFPPSPEIYEPKDSPPPPTAGPTTISTSELDSFAAHILEGRHRKNRTINIVEYNAGEVYAQNAADLATGRLREDVAPVRAIGTGRHQLSQLLNNVQDQRESLEEQFAKNRRIKKESGAKYGW